MKRTHFGCLLHLLSVALTPVSAQVLNFGGVNVGTAAPVQTLTYSFSAATTISVVNILTAGAPGLDYTDGGGSTCFAGTTYTAGQSCTVTVAFVPLAPGLRSGGVTLFAQGQGNNLPLVTWYVNGIGQAGAVTIDPGPRSTISTLSSNGQAYGLTNDGAGNIYVVDHANSQVIELAAGTFSQSTTVASGLSDPTAVALDGAGNLYISDTGNGRVEVVPKEQGALNGADMSTVGINGLGSPRGLATDANGNLYVADATNGVVFEVPAGGGTPIPVVSGLASPHGIALDSAGNIYVASENQVAEYPVGGGTSIPFGSGYSEPRGVAVDAAGVVYVADFGNSQIVVVTPGGTSQTIMAVTGIGSPQALSLDATNNVYVSSSNSVFEVNRANAVLAFSNTNVDSSSALQMLTVSDAGNQPLTVTNLTIPGNFMQVPSGGMDCASGSELFSAGQCSLAIAFVPVVSGNLAGTATLSDSALNNSASAQTIQLSGAALQVAQTISFPIIPNQLYGASPITLSAASSSGLPVIYAVIAGAASVSGSTLTITGAGSVTVQASQSGNAQYAPASSVSQTFAVNQAPTTVGWSNPTPIIYGTPLSVTQLNATATPVSAGTYVYTPSAGTLLNAGSQILSVQFTPNNSNYAVSTSSVTLSVNQATQTVTFPTIPAQTYGVGPLLLSATASSGLTVSFTVVSGPATIGGSDLTMTGVGMVTVRASQAGNANYTTAPPVSQTFTVNQANQTITFTQNAPKTAPYDGSFSVAATASSGLPVSFTGSGVCTNVGAVFTMTNSGGTCTVKASQAGNPNYLAAATVTQSTAASNASQTVTFTGAPATAAYLSIFTVAATSNSGIAASITASGACSISGTTVTMTSGTAKCTLTAKWAGNNYYLSTSLTQTTSAEKLNSVVTWSTPAGIIYPAPLSAVQLNANANVAGSFAYSPKAGTVLSAGSQVLNVTFTPTLSQDYTTVPATATIQVNQAIPTLTWSTPAAITYGTALSATQLDATANVAGNLVYSPKAGTVLAAGSETLSVTFAPSLSQDYTTATASTTIQVNPAKSTVTWHAPAAITYGTALTATQLDATANVPGTFAYSPAAGAVLGAGSQTLSLQFTPSSANYVPASANVTLKVNQASQTITFPTIPSQPFGGAPYSLNATASSGLPVSYAVASGPATVNGTLLTITGLGSGTVQASQAGNANYAAAKVVTQPFSVTGVAAAPSVPTNLRVDIADGNTGQLIVTWTQSAVTQANPAPNNYILQRSTSPSSGYSTVANCSGAANFNNTTTPFNSNGGATYMCRDNNAGAGLIVSNPATYYYYQVQACIGSAPCSNPIASVSNTPISCNCTQNSSSAQIPPMIYSSTVAGQTTWQNLVPPAINRVATSTVDSLATYAVTDSKGNPIDEIYATANPGPAGWPIPPQNKLFVELPGSGSVCSYSPMMYTAQNLGFDTMCVNYSNHTQQETICFWGAPTNGDPGCFGTISQAKFDGSGPCGVVNSDPTDCGEDPYPGPNEIPFYTGSHDAVYSRILTMLEFLTGNTGNNPCITSGYWGQYLLAQYQTETNSYCALNWSQILLGGWSQGGDMATYTAGLEAQNGTPIVRAINWSAPPQATQVNGIWTAATYFSGWFPGSSLGSVFGLVSANDTRYTPPGTDGVYQSVWAALGFTPGPPNYDGQWNLNESGNLQAINCNMGTPSNNLVNFAPANPYSGDGHLDTIYIWNQDIYEFMLLDN